MIVRPGDTRLKDRRWRVTVHGRQFEELDVRFEIMKTLDPEPNKCTLEVKNLSAETRRFLESLNLYEPKHIKGVKQEHAAKELAAKTGRKPKPGRIVTEIEAGYASGTSLIWRGDLRRAISKREDATIITEIEGEDGGWSVLASRINETFPAGTTKFDVVRACAQAMGLGLGNIREVSADLRKAYDRGTVVNGQASRELAMVLRAEGITYSVQDGVLKFRKVGQGLTTRGILLNEDTGLIKFPSLDTHGAVVVQTLMIPDVAPGSYAKLESEQYNGDYLIRTVTTRGDSAGEDWGHELELYPA